ncbi:hypothetical protein C4D60_Mb06t21070 [Musa balbisiana]|uniref:Uncharacterized protein n=1 Tax=Musa balbisiana TaxID=52838 RepID=A0A4S8IPM3_MUSBA|nr:hypothetical protein C4D60_Mb06t21070 [Musa balbisiana]
MQRRLFTSSDASSVDANKLDDCSSDLQVPSFSCFHFQILLRRPFCSYQRLQYESYMEQLKKEICSAEEENTNISSEVETLTRMVTGDLVQLDGDLEALTCSLKFFDSQIKGDDHFKGIGLLDHFEGIGLLGYREKRTVNSNRGG